MSDVGGPQPAGWYRDPHAPETRERYWSGKRWTALRRMAEASPTRPERPTGDRWQAGGAAAGWYSDPEMAHTLRYWDGSTWTDHRSPDVAAAPPGSRPDNAVAWTLAFAPLVAFVIAVVLARPDIYAALALTPDGYYSATLAATLVLNIALAVWDEKKLAAVGIHINAGLALVLIPVYLFVRARRVPGTTAIPIVWCACFLVILAAGY